MAEQTNLPSIPPPNENNLVAFARAVKEALEVRLGRRGQGLDAMVTFRDLDKVQMVLGDGRGGVLGLKPPAGNGGGAVDPDYDPTTDMLPPPAPQNVKASGAVRNVILEWAGPPSTYRNHAYAEIWRSSTNNLNDAAQIGQSGSTMYVDNVGEGQARYYWVRFVSQANVTGPWHAAADNGAQAVTALDVGYTLGLLEGQIGESALATEIIDGKDAFVFDTKTFAIRFNETGYTPFITQSAPTTINGVEIPPGVYLDAAFMRTFVAQKGQIGDLAVDDAAIASVSAEKVTFGEMEGDRIRTNSLDANRIRTGTLFAGVEITAGERLRISAEGWIETYSAAGYSRSADYSRLDYGNIQLYRYVPALGQPVLYNYLSRLESGIGANNVEVTLPGYWRSQPKIMVSPAVLSLYRHDYANQSQAIRCEAINIQETGVGTMQYKFTPRAQLELAAATGAITINVNATSSSDSWTSATYTTPANTSSVTLNVDLGSVRGTGTSGSYYYRQVAWRVMYLSGGSWVAGAWRTKAIGATLNQVADTLAFDFPSAAAWQFYVEYSASDAGGTFTTGSPQYDYASQTVTNSVAVSGEASRSVNQSTGSSGTTTQAVTMTLPSYSPPSGYSVYEVTYNYTAGYYLYSYEAGCDATASVSGGPDASLNAGGSYTIPKSVESGDVSLDPDSNPSLISAYQNYSKSSTSYSATAISVSCSASVTKRSFGGSMAVAKAKISYGEAVIKSRRLVTNSTTPSNSALFKSYSYSLSSALVLATGQLNWLAVGE